MEPVQMGLTMTAEDLHQLRQVCEVINLSIVHPLPILGFDSPEVWCALESLASSLQDHVNRSVKEEKKVED
jgi:hypothetical protein